ncbi:ribosome recycling factor [candidate division WOR-3 bacterium]|nr:ribosome recycling factor [candidate division WOR-3 bacterium]
MPDLKKLISVEKDKMEKCVEHFKGMLSKIQTGRAVPALLEGITVKYYGNDTPVKQVCNVTIPEPRMIVLQPYDKSLIGEIEKSIAASNIGVNPQSDGKVIRLIFPMLSEDRREEGVKHIKKLGEEVKTTVRNTRHQFINQAKKMLKSNEISDDEHEVYEEEIQQLTNEYISLIEKIVESKEKEIKTI